ncbi:putative RNA 2'-phosphotransferase [Saccharopolyspora antimicrobica]|uniref:Probable RNA 2'-phosphotransferase n=1 Tax=Saccharopolyspora antimicrobica TaxID=455193 RepID=A0A1I5HSY4_9PSEU|nr:RNA 2'-phosphotransferase [Saccharopolyspora antimicrobica]RKT82360.1 putative RNA 2'-phosphotransferase [Saccharopolyspora antimicrobica]SFO51006.1 putative RNA 2'-phosphotransferase [Saccharopolyspora antimicrobica]
MDEQRLVRISKYLAKHLRHQPERIGVELDANGWVDVEVLLAAAAAHRFPISRAELAEVVASNDKQRYVIDGDRIRASQGHSVPVDLDLPVSEPPAFLFHGTVGRNLAAIRQEGLRPMGRQHVHLSTDRETAQRVGARRGRPVVLAIRAGAMHEAGHEFRVSANGVWLTAHVAPSFIDFQGP